jgi:hypothetical protein
VSKGSLFSNSAINLLLVNGRTCNFVLRRLFYSRLHPVGSILTCVCSIRHGPIQGGGNRESVFLLFSKALVQVHSQL